MASPWTLTEAVSTGSTLAAARCYVATGLSVFPVRTDGSKAPKLAKGEVEQYRERFPTDGELQKWFGSGGVGIAVVCGKVSGNLAVLDFESDAVWVQWLKRLAECERASLIAGAPIVRTPKGGRHVYCRLREGWVAGGKLAMKSKAETLVEIRGQGHYVLAPGCPVACHPLGKPYSFIEMGWLAK